MWDERHFEHLFDMLHRDDLHHGAVPVLDQHVTEIRLRDDHGLDSGLGGRLDLAL